MKSITIHGLDDPLNSLIREKARKQGLSLNKTIKKLLAETLGLNASEPGLPDNEFGDLCGKWSPDDMKEFNQSTRDLRKIDPVEWE